MKPVTTAALLLVLFTSQTSCLIDVRNYEFQKNEIFRGNHTKDPIDKTIEFKESKGTIYTTSLSQLPDIHNFWFEKSNLDKIEDGALCSSPGVTRINFYWNNLPKLTSGTFASCVELAYIVYERNSVDHSAKTFSDDAFSGLSNLKTLTIRETQGIPHVPKTLFKGLNKLIILRIKWSDLETVENAAFDDLVKLRILDLRNNRLAVLDNTLFSKLTELKELDLSRNNFKNLGNGLLANLNSLEVLDVSWNQLENHPRNDVVGLSKLRRFDFRHNKFETKETTTWTTTATNTTASF